MRSRFRSFTAFLAILSLLATFVPSLAWACPVTGRVGTPLEICAPSAQCHNPKMAGMACCQKKPKSKTVSLTTNQPCAAPGCCHVVLSPNTAQVSATVSAKTENRDAQSFQIFSTLDFLAAAPLEARLSGPLILPPLYGPEISPPHSQHSFSLYSGRAPPVALKIA
jgi:hypothetical protein